jgi:dephospho-CoA kinase
MKRIGLTGGIGSGKSTAAGFFRAAGVPVVDADAISRSLTAQHGEAVPLLVQAFGSSILGSEGVLDRVRLRQMVFSSDTTRQLLESVMHPLIADKIATAVRDAEDGGARELVLDIPLLVENQDRWRPFVDKVCIVDCSIDTQVQRVMKRSNMCSSDVLAIIDKQATRSSRLRCADIVIYNEQLTLDALESNVNAICKDFAI